MALVEPVALQFVRPELTGEVPSPPHDALTPEARRHHIQLHPLSYLGVTRAPDDVDGDGTIAGGDVLEAGRDFLQMLLDDGVFGPKTDPSYFVYRLETPHHRQTGLVCAVATQDYESGVVRIHERINSVRAAHLARHLRVVGAQSSPIALAFNSRPNVTEIMARAAENQTPMLDFEDENRLRQQLWQLTDPDETAQISAAFAGVPLYLIDGHHRAAAASEDRSSLPEAQRDRHRMLATLFPYDELRSEAFHRVLTGVDLPAFERHLGERFATRLVTDGSDVADRSDTELALALPGEHPEPRWLLVDVPFNTDDQSGLSNIDPVRLSRNVLKPLLGIEEPTPDERLAYRPGMADLDAIAAIRLRPDEAIFLMRPIPATALMSISDAGEVMPPKSTYFQPKVRSGIFIRLVD